MLALRNRLRTVSCTEMVPTRGEVVLHLVSIHIRHKLQILSSRKYTLCSGLGVPSGNPLQSLDPIRRPVVRVPYRGPSTLDLPRVESIQPLLGTSTNICHQTYT